MRSATTSPTAAEITQQFPHLFSESIENMLDGFYVLDSDLRYIYMNKNAEGFLIASKDTVLGKRIDEVYPDVFKTTTGKAIKQALKTKQVQQLEMYYKDANKWLLNTIYPLTDGLVIQVHDISIRKNNEHNLLFLAKASEVLSTSLNYEETLKNLVEVAVPTIGDWCVVDTINEQGKVNLFALKHKDPRKIKLAEELRQKFPPEKSDSSGIHKVLRTGKSEMVASITEDMIVKTISNKEQLRLVKAIGLTSLMIVPIIVKKSVLGVITLATSESRRHYTKADLAMAEELANRVALAIENATLYKEAQFAIQQRNEFISIASHELKTPVTSIKAYEQMLQRRFIKLGDASSASLLQKMDEQLNRLNQLISGLLDVTRIETDKLVLHNDYYAFDDLVVETVENMQHSMCHAITIQGATNRKVYGDRVRTGQVLMNLLSNAEKYSPNDRQIIVKLNIRDEVIEACVQDFGMGIPQDKIDKVFDRFYRVNGPKEETYPGLGLGLYISNEIIKRQGGKMWVDSEVGTGSTFCFQLPIFLEN